MQCVLVGRHHAERAVWPDLVVSLSPSLAHDLGLQQIAPHFSAQHLFHKDPVEPLVLPILPRRTGRDQRHFASHRAHRFLEKTTGELAPIVAADERRNPSLHKQPQQHTAHIRRAHLALDLHRQRFSRVFVEHRQDLERLAITGSVADEIERPDLVSQACLADVTGVADVTAL